MKSLSCQQRNYFIQRIEDEINKEINALEQLNATTISKATEKQYKLYLKETGIDKIVKEYKECESKWENVRNRMDTIVTDLHHKMDYPGKKDNYGTPSTYNSESVEKFFHQICTSIARQGFLDSVKGKRLRELETKKTAAVDIVMGMVEVEPTVVAVNKILKGTNVPLLGGK